ncbi:MAG: crosslink repair DNA glycosylase YcaQ family protein [Betaproteobacteria bacterium]
MTLAELRRYAVARAFGEPLDLLGAIRRLGYLQADPIRAPARAQDLILRQRVAGYRIDDLESRYPHLPVIEDVLHNYGFFPAEHRALLYPRTLSTRWREFIEAHRPLRRKLRNFLDEQGEAHPREVERVLGAGARINGWGGTSSATTLMLDALHREGIAHVRRREKGQRVYALAPPRSSTLSPAARADGIIGLLIELYAPMAERSLMRVISMMGSHKPDVDFARRIDLLVRRGKYRRASVDGLAYLWPAHETVPEANADEVRFLAPFDPLVWDRLRFEHLWGWAYRFEAYTPASKRTLGYYALPLLWRDHVIGWANTSKAGDQLNLQIGYASGKLARGQRAGFNSSLESETERYRRFLVPAPLQALLGASASRP